MMIMNAAMYCKAKVDSLFRRVFKEQAGGAELIATLIIVGIVLVLAMTFKDKLGTLVENLWNDLVKGDKTGATAAEVAGDWSAP